MYSMVISNTNNNSKSITNNTVNSQRRIYKIDSTYVWLPKHNKM